MKKPVKLILIGLLFGLNIFSFGVGNNAPGITAAAGATRIIKVGTNRALGTVTPYVGKSKGIFNKQGVTLDIVDFSDGSTLMEAFASGQLDIGILGIAPAAIWQGKGVALKVVASANGGGHVLLTREDTGITSITQLKGRKVATPKPGTVTDTLFRVHIIQKLAGLNPEKDIQIVPGLAPADMPTALFVVREVVITWEPFASQAEAQFKGGRVLFDAAAEWRKKQPKGAFYPVNVVIARQSFIDQYPDQLRRFLVAYQETVDFINQQPGQANEIISREIQLDKSIVAKARRRIDYTVQIDTTAALETLEWSKELGYLSEIPQAAKLFDLRFLPRSRQK
jgi:NitT/TauT family transport system substrate-binding protein